MLKIKPKIQPSAVQFSTLKVKIETEVLNNFNAAFETFTAQNPDLEAQNLNAFLTEQVAILLKKATQQLQKKHQSVAKNEAAFAGMLNEVQKCTTSQGKWCLKVHHPMS